MVNKNHQVKIIEDIEILQRIQNKEIFKKASGLFLKKWKTLETITLNLWTKGYQWAKINKSISSKQKGESTEYYLPANDDIKTTQKEIDYIKQMK